MALGSAITLSRNPFHCSTGSAEPDVPALLAMVHPTYRLESPKANAAIHHNDNKRLPRVYVRMNKENDMHYRRCFVFMYLVMRNGGARQSVNTHTNTQRYR